MRGLCRPATLRNTRRDDSRAVAHPGSLVPDSPRSLMVHHNVVCTEVLRRHVDLVKEVLAELLARPILVVARLVLAAAEPAPLEVARAAADVVAAAVLLGGDAALGACLRVGADPLGRLDLWKRKPCVGQRKPRAAAPPPPKTRPLPSAGRRTFAAASPCRARRSPATARRGWRTARCRATPAGTLRRRRCRTRRRWRGGLSAARA